MDKNKESKINNRTWKCKLRKNPMAAGEDDGVNGETVVVSRDRGRRGGAGCPCRCWMDQVGCGDGGVDGVVNA